MKKALFTLFIITLSLFSNAAMDEIVLTKDGVARDRFDFPVPIDMPDLYYYSKTQEKNIKIEIEVKKLEILDIDT